MQNKTLQMKRALRTALLVLLLSVVGLGKGYAQSFTYNNCTFTINNDGERTVTAKYYDSNSSYGSVPSVAIRSNYPSVPYSTKYYVTQMAASFFSGNHKITSAHIGNHISVIPSGSFNDCYKLTSVELPNSISKINSRTFFGCRVLSMITIPDGVTSIETSAFQNCQALRTINIPDGVTTIGENAFNNCNSLTTIEFPSSLTTIQEGAFSNCNNITGPLTIPSSVAYIGDQAFNGTNVSIVNYNAINCTSNGSCFACPSITILNIGEDVRVIPDNLFSQCSGLSTVSFSNSNTLTSIGTSSFSDCISLTSLVIPNSVTSIGEKAFSGCTRLTSISISNSITSIKSETFSGCSGLTSVTIPNSVTSIGERAFFNCSGLVFINIPNSVTSIESEAFSGCSGLTSITIPNSVTSIGEKAFSGCIGLTSITIPSSVTSIAEEAFSQCTNLTEIIVEEGNLHFKSVDGVLFNYSQDKIIKYPEAKQGDYVIPNSITTIDAYAFSGCNNLNSVTIPYSIVHIGVSAFSNCSNLTKIEYNAISCDIDESTYGVESWLSGCESLTTIVIGEEVSVIPSYAFHNQKNLSLVVINGESVIEIGNHAFSECSKLLALILPASLTKIGDYAFALSGLTSIIIPNSVIEIGMSAFYGCTGLTFITMNNSIIGENMFVGCSGLVSVDIGDFVKTIEKGAFGYCENLASITIGKAVNTIGTKAFENCPRLTMVYYNAEKNLVASNNIFYNCPNLTTIHIGADVQEIGANIFRGCTGVHLIVALGPTPATLVGDAFTDFADNSILMVSCGNRLNYFSVWNIFDFNNILEDCGQYPIDMNNIGTGGNVSASTTQAQMGQEVQLTVTPNEGMALSSLTVCNASDPTQTFPVYPISKGNKFGFIMPPYGVSVNATFATGTSVDENSYIPAMVYPNPTNGQVKIEAEDLKQITISNMLGQVIYESKASGNTFEYDFSKHKTGIYLIRIETANGVAVKKVSVTR